MMMDPLNPKDIKSNEMKAELTVDGWDGRYGSTIGGAVRQKGKTSRQKIEPFDVSRHNSLTYIGVGTGIPSRNVEYQ